MRHLLSILFGLALTAGVAIATGVNREAASFDAMDANSDNRVTQQEAGNYSNDWIDANSFAEIDVDNNGYWSRDEFRNANTEGWIWN